MLKTLRGLFTDTQRGTWPTEGFALELQGTLNVQKPFLNFYQVFLKVKKLS